MDTAGRTLMITNVLEQIEMRLPTLNSKATGTGIRSICTTDCLASCTDVVSFSKADLPYHRQAVFVSGLPAFCEPV